MAARVIWLCTYVVHEAYGTVCTVCI
jgi:hypothetical protein